MHTESLMPARKTDLSRILHYLLLAWSLGLACAPLAWAQSPADLHERYASLAERLQQSPFKRPLVLDSSESPDRVQGEIYAVMDHSFSEVNASLRSPEHWCDVMILHLNIKYCRAQTGPSGTTLRIHVGRKTPQSLADSERIDFSYREAKASAEHLEITLKADQGPLGTSDYQIRLDAVPLAGNRTFLHLSYSYATNIVGRAAMETYLATVGSEKLGFTVTGTQADGQTEFIGGLRGVVERNTMRYYLAIDAFLEAENAAPAERLERRMQNWFTATESYPRQLHEMDRASYLEMKRAEVARQNSVPE
jgi:hypothetical protein